MIRSIDGPLISVAEFARHEALFGAFGLTHSRGAALSAELVAAAFVVDLPDLGGRRRLTALGIDVHTLCAFEGA